MDPMRIALARPILAVLLATGCGSEGPDPATREAERLALPADAANGQRLFRACAVCHDAARSADHRVGPNLWGVVGAPAGRHPDFAYSRALERSGVVWSEEVLDAYLADPEAVIPGGRMAYAGAKSAADRRDIIAYLKTRAGEED